MSSGDVPSYSLTVIRHGESEWNHENLFCGWVDVGLTDTGLAQARKATASLVRDKVGFDVIFTSVLKRARDTAEIIRTGLEQAGLVQHLEIVPDWRLNERHYGSLTGHNKAQMAEKYGKDQVQTWRRSYDIRPPPIDESHPYYLPIRQNPALSIVPEEQFPDCECLKDLQERAVPYFEAVIAPKVKSGARVLIVVHGTTSRALVKHLEDVSEEAIEDINVPNAIPFTYQLDRDFKPTGEKSYHADEKTVEMGIAKAASIGKK
eukprot:maker-scaffold455_size166772-snap-gene-0.34 protein:Tk12517 transcript:maker-scaffold455_size166772-snap-gene-0.34-mRNA-1 annotation:"phosphoglycerate mutase 2-like isoform x2"